MTLFPANPANLAIVTTLGTKIGAKFFELKHFIRGTRAKGVK